FRRFTDHIVAVFHAHISPPTDQDEARAAVVDLVHAPSEGRQPDLPPTQELHTLAARRPGSRQPARDWIHRSPAHLKNHSDPDTARQLDALIGGLTLHRALARRPHDRALTLEAVPRITTNRQASESRPEPGPVPKAR